MSGNKIIWKTLPTNRFINKINPNHTNLCTCDLEETIVISLNANCKVTGREKKSE